MSHYHLTSLDNVLGEMGRMSPTAKQLVEQCTGLITAQHQNALKRGGMAQASIQTVDKDIFLRDWQL